MANILPGSTLVALENTISKVQHLASNTSHLVDAIQPRIVKLLDLGIEALKRHLGHKKD